MQVSDASEWCKWVLQVSDASERRKWMLQVSDASEWCKRVPQVMAQVEATDDSLGYHINEKKIILFPIDMVWIQ